MTVTIYVVDNSKQTKTLVNRSNDVQFLPEVGDLVPGPAYTVKVASRHLEYPDNNILVVYLMEDANA
jgi:hypothetical protein